MRKVALDNVKLGTKLARTIFCADGRILLTRGAILNESYLERLKFNGIEEIYREDRVSEDIEIKEIIREETRVEAKRIVREIMNDVLFSNSHDVEKIKEIVNSIIDQILKFEKVISNLIDIKTVDDYTFAHSVNVCVMSVLIGVELNYNIERLNELGVGAILHDIGKMKVPGHILKKPVQLDMSEFEEIKKHTVYGYEILSSLKDISMTSAVIALSHHERFDGTGYPLQIKGHDIHEYARIVAVTDVYDALTSDRVYRKKIRPHEVFEYITSLARNHYDNRVVNSFVKYISMYPIGSGVLLNNRERAIVLKENRKYPTRPVVRIVLDNSYNRVTEYRDLDLCENTKIYIVDSCEV